MALRKEAKKEERAFWLFISPWLLGFLLFGGGPILASLLLSFTKYDIISSAKFIGLKNYTSLFNDKMFYNSLSSTTYYVALAVPFLMLVSLFIAVLLNTKIRGKSFFRTAYYLPSLVAGVSVAYMWAWLLNSELGVINTLLRQWFGIEGPKWFAGSTTVVPSFALMQLTSAGGAMVIFLASLQSLPQELYEAATIDGSGKIRSFFSITLPLISPVILFNTVIAIIASFQIFTQAFIITSGGPNWKSYFYVYFLFDTAFKRFAMGLASAQAWILFLLIFVLTLLVLWISRRIVYYEDENIKF